MRASSARPAAAMAMRSVMARWGARSVWGDARPDDGYVRGGDREDVPVVLAVVCPSREPPPPAVAYSGSDLKQSLPQSLAHGVGAADGTKLAKQRLDVEFDGMLGDAEPARRGLVAEPIGDCRQHLSFAGCQQRASPSSNASNDGEERPGTRTINPAAAA